MRLAMLSLSLAVAVSGCASRLTSRTPDQVAAHPRYCGDAVYQPQDGFAAEALAEIAVTEPAAYRCNPDTADRTTPQHYQDIGTPTGAR